MGMTYDELEQIKQIKHDLIKDLIEYGRKDGKLNEVDTLAHAIKNICKIIESAEQEMGYSGYNPMRDWAYDPSVGMAVPSYGGYSHSWSTSRGPSAPRDSMGRYSSHGNLTNELYSLMNTASNETERQELQNLINRLEHQNR